MKIKIEKKQSYPFLGEAKDGLRVYFTSYRTGIAVDCDPDEVINTWTMSLFKILWQAEPATEEITNYPCVGVDERGLEVLFIGYGIGRAVTSNNTYNTGDLRTDWAMPNFKKVPCKITFEDE
jgi:hypothetical protein